MGFKAGKADPAACAAGFFYVYKESGQTLTDTYRPGKAADSTSTARGFRSCKGNMAAASAYFIRRRFFCPEYGTVKGLLLNRQEKENKRR